MVGHLMGTAPSGRGRPSRLVRDQSALRLVGTSPGSLVALLELSPPVGAQHNLWRCGQEAVNRLLSWEGEQDRSLPPRVTAELMAARRGLSDEVDLIRLTAPDIGRSLTLTRASHTRARATPVTGDTPCRGD